MKQVLFFEVTMDKATLLLVFDVLFLFGPIWALQAPHSHELIQKVVEVEGDSPNITEVKFYVSTELAELLSDWGYLPSIYNAPYFVS